MPFDNITTDLLLEVTGKYAGLVAEQRKIMASEVLRIGRREDNDWIFPQPFVSRMQMILRRIGGLYLLERVGSCPVAMNDPARIVALGGIVAVRPGDRIFIDDIEIQVEAVQPPDEEAQPPDEDVPPESESSSDEPRVRLDERWFADEPARPVNFGGGVEREASGAGSLDDLLSGAGSDTATHLSAPAARELGVILRICVDSLILMLLARRDVRREMDAAGTELARSGNPLKAARDSASAWAALLSLAGAGDGSATTAVKQVFEDIRYHEMALLSGHRAAFDHVIETFHPESLAAEFAPKAVAALLPAVIKRGWLWGGYIRKYGALLSDADDAYRTLFRRRFARAYEQTISELKQIAQQRHAAGTTEESAACR